jgi:hypothetical protein
VLDFDARQLEAIGVASLVDRVRTFLAEEFADARAADPLALADELRARLDEARECGLDTARAAATLLVLGWLFGSGFEHGDAALERSLAERDRGAEEKRALIEIWALAAAARLGGGGR